MSFTRKSLADTIDAYDADIEKLQASKRETFSDYREQLGLEGRDKDGVKAEIAAFKAAMKRRRVVAKEGEEAVEEQADLVDAIFVEITAARAPRVTRVENIDEFPTKSAVAAFRDDPNMAIVDPANLKKNTETQPAPQAGSDLTSPQAPGQVAPIQPETANEKPETDDTTTSDPQRSVADAREDAGSVVSGDIAGSSNGRTAAFDAVNAGSTPAPAPKPRYARTGVVVWESAPPEGVVRHEYSQAFGEAGQDLAVIQDELERAASQPIVKIGNVILDGWARYMQARSMTGLDGKSIEYPVEQYGGSDPLLDCIYWNFQGRMMTHEQKFRVAQKLTKLEPKRKIEIYAAFELGMELA